MSRLWRATVLAVLTTALVIGPASAAFATTGDSGERGDPTRDRTTDRPVDHVGDVPVDIAVDQPSDQVTDRPADLDGDRPTDRTTDRPRDRVQRPECDRDQEADRVHDCPPQDDRIRPALARCVEYVQSHTDLVIRRNMRWWWHVCNRIAWNHNHPE